MCRYNKKSGGWAIDPCMRPLINNLQELGIKTLACCCGHGKYKMSVVVDMGKGKDIVPVEIFSNVVIPRKKRFYVKDEKGRYVIPETLGGEL